MNEGTIQCLHVREVRLGALDGRLGFGKFLLGHSHPFAADLRVILGRSVGTIDKRRKVI